jgi:hypothetical protein
MINTSRQDAKPAKRPNKPEIPLRSGRLCERSFFCPTQLELFGALDSIIDPEKPGKEASIPEMGVGKAIKTSRTPI